MDATYQAFVDQSLTSEQCHKGMHLLEQISQDVDDGKLADMRECWKALREKARRLEPIEALATKTCTLCNGSKVAYVYVDSIGQESAGSEPERYGVQGRPVNCPVCKGLGRIKPRG